jgi:ABC-type sulfate transport system substrate-binding protein
VENLAIDSVVEEVKSQWKRMWRERIDDHVRAEGVACDGYDMLFVEKGTVLIATRNFKLLNLREILEQHKVDNPERLVSPSTQVGGWGKFIRNNIVKGTSRRSRRYEVVLENERRPQHLKKGGRGWLHV